MKKALKNIRRTKMLAQSGRCYYCDLPMWDATLDHRLPAMCSSRGLPKFLQCTAEHLLPRSEGGKDTAENIVAACWYCNTSRHKRKCAPSPRAYRTHVRKRMAAGRWLAAQVATCVGRV
jgi:5-methylcytosine-specific restriction endonuclease McrA